MQAQDEPASYPNSVALTHQRGCWADRLRAAAAAARVELNSPKQVAPEPDMRARLATRLFAQSREHPRDRRLELDGSGLEIVAPAGEKLDQASAVAGQSRPRAARFRSPPGLRPEHCEHVLVGTATPGLTSTPASSGIASGAESNSPMPRIRRARGSTQTGTSAPIRRAAICRRLSPGLIRLARASRRSAAPASDDPPPNPAATGRRFSSIKRPSFKSGNFSRQCLPGLEHEIVIQRTGLLGGEATHSERKYIAWHKGQAIAFPCKHHQAVEQMIAVGAPPKHGEREIDLGRGVFDELRHTGISTVMAGLVPAIPTP